MALTKVKNSNLEDQDLVALSGNDGSNLTGVVKPGDIGSTVEAYDATILKDADIGSTVEAYDATILKDADIGTTANKLVQLDGTAKLPAVDGSQLTNLPASGGVIEATASGALANGDKVILNSDGSVSKIAVSTHTFTSSVGSANTFNNNTDKK